MSNAWMSVCPESERKTMLRALDSVDSGATCQFVGDAAGLRNRLQESEPGRYGAIVGLTKSGISDINLAAAIAADGRAQRVVLVRRSPSGSLRSRAARAGIDLVINPDDLPGVVASETVRTRAVVQDRKRDGGLDSVLPTRVTLSEGHAPVITFCSGRGGVGKTSIVACGAVAAASWGMSVEVVDLDLSCGNLYSAFGLPGGSDLSRLSTEIIDDSDELQRTGLTATDGVRLWGPCKRPETAELAMPLVANLIERLSAMSDLVLIDTSPTFTEAVATASTRSDRVVLVHDQRPGSLASLARTSGLVVRLGVARTRIARLENRANPRTRPDPSFGRAEVGLEAARGFRVFDGGDEVADYISAGEAAELVKLGSPFTDSVSSSLAQILEELGRLPSCDEAKRAAHVTRERKGIFGRRREAS
ncbi:MAG: AAA family ATPase [Tractidigestivibacter sp.]|jgi:MinD-like ATPase involved in chromosome partitioning or flagellar assembly|uniref:AAA family ATPase n=1 Tax=Tractidigestivibacter sp. TaxID=2847320 RepID=UPI003D8F29DB